MATTYTVKPGDTLSAIGSQFGVPYQSITGYRSGNPNLIYPGEVLTIGGGSAPAPAQQQAPAQQSYSQTSMSSSGGGAVAGITYSPNWQAEALKKGIDVNSPQFASFRQMDQQRSSSGGSSGFMNAPTINLPQLYNNLYQTSGIQGLQGKYDAITSEINKRTEARNTAEATINDNPFYSEGTRTGRVAKLNQIYNNDINAQTQQARTVQDQIATQKADIETQLNLQSQQFNIDSQQAQLALQQFNTLLSAGALDNATGEDIASITRATGMSSSMIYGAIDSMKKSKNPTQMIQYDDGVNQGYVTVDSNGNILNRQVVSVSKTATTQANKSSGSGSGGGTSSKISTTARKAIASVDSQKGGKTDKLLSSKEFAQAVEKVMTEANVDDQTAKTAVAQAMVDLNYGTWKW